MSFNRGKKLVLLVDKLQGTKHEGKNPQSNKTLKSYSLRQGRKQINYSQKITGDKNESEWSDFSSGSSDNVTFDTTDLDENSESEIEDAFKLDQPQVSNIPKETEASSSQSKIKIISHYKFFPETHDSLSVCSDSAKSETQEDFVIPLGKQIILNNASPFKNKFCNVGIDSIDQEAIPSHAFCPNTVCDLKKGQSECLLEVEKKDDVAINILKSENIENIDCIGPKEKKTDLIKPERMLVNFGKINEKLPDFLEEVEHIKSKRPWTKKNSCLYCFKEITHFARHLERNHKEEGAVQKLIALSKKDPQKKILLNCMRRQGNYLSSNQTNKLRPVRRPVEKPKEDQESKENYIACTDCFGYFKRNYLRRHKKKCALRSKSKNTNLRENHLSEAQLLAICSGPYTSFYNSLRLKNEVFPIMRCDEISRTAMSDVLICCYAEDQLGKHKRIQMRNVISNKMRELGRLLIELKKTTGAKKLIDLLKPEFFDSITTATKVISGYNAESRTYKAGSLALHMGTTLRQICDTATKTIIKKSPFLPCVNPEITLKDLKRIRALFANHWNTEVSSLALKNLNEQRWEKPKMFPLTSDLMHFQEYVTKQIKIASDCIEKGKDVKKQYRRLSECVLALTLLLNRKRIGEIQYLTLKTYNTDISSNLQEEFLETLTESEKILTKNFKRVVTGGKGSKPVPILFTRGLQKSIDLMLTVREKCVPKNNEYLFANPNKENRWLSGYHTLKKLALESGANNTDLFTSTRLRKQIATILQVMNINESEMEQFASFMGHTKKTHENYYRLPQDVFQTAKVSKLLLAINKGKGAMYKGKTLEEIQLSDNVDSDSEVEIDLPLKPNETKEMFSKSNISQNQYQRDDSTSPVASTSKITNNAKKPLHDDSSQEESSTESKSDESDIDKTKKKKPNKIQRIRWTDKQKSVITEFFKEHIKHKRAPKKHEVEMLMEKNKELFKGRNWVKIKAVVYNCYKNK